MARVCPDCGCDLDSHTVNSFIVRPANELWYVLHCGSCGTCWKTRGNSPQRQVLAGFDTPNDAPAGTGANRDGQGNVLYGETGNYGTCVRCGRTLNDNVDQGDVCYSCTETLEAERNAAEGFPTGAGPTRRCLICRGELAEGQTHDHTDDSPEIPDWAFDRPRGDY